MASAPAPQTSRRRSNNQSQARQSPTLTAPTRVQSQESQTIFDQPEQQQQETMTGASEESDEAEKKCWICFSDSSEDTPETSPWRDPCPCALVAHEECLLDWIADMEAPKNSRSRSVKAPKIECPQCKSEIKLARPTNYIVDAVRGFERLGDRIVTPGAIMAFCGVVYSSSVAWGAHSIYAVFGAEDGFRILRPIIYNATRAPIEVYVGSPRDATKQFLTVLTNHLVHWRLYVGLPLITPVLILSRSNLADGILPVLPIVFFASQTPPNGVLDFRQWPPSASFVFALLPYVRSIYNTYYERVWAARERQWLREIQPRAGQNENEEAGNADDRDAFDDDDDDNGHDDEEDQDGEEDGVIPILDIEIPLFVAADDDEAPPAQQQRPPGHLAQAQAQAQAQQQQQLAQQAAQQQAQPQAQAQPQPAPQQPDLRDARLNIVGREVTPFTVLESILGALIFPSVAGLAGEALRLVLPTSWTSVAAAAKGSQRFGTRPVPRGLLQQKWGRTVVGGCLFVVAKDALMLYVRWKMAQMHRKRRVVDFERNGVARG